MNEALASTSPTVIRFTVHGRPQPGGSKRGFRLPGTNRVVITDANKNAKPWQHQIREAARTVYSGPLLTQALVLTVRFYFARPKGHFGSGRNAMQLVDSAPAHHTQKPDALKVARSLEDALTGVVYRDDCLIVEEHLTKHWTTESERLEVEIAVLDGTGGE